ncbi:hypothetical protein [uncultured Clostridium sp.]|uniref:hypothetical protein n=1 Tax=uncultured Clostridium sp. TaxID=59620 RepID=UPI0025F999BB|nr:hypothetical protein [uncultured Clostridium sp.]
MNDTNTQNKELFTTGMLAKQLKTSNNVITNACKKCLPNKQIINGKTTYYTEEEATIIIKYLQDNPTKNPTYNNLIIGTKTSMSDELDFLLLQKQQAEIQKKLDEYRNNRILELENCLERKNNYIKALEHDNKFKTTTLESFIRLSSPKYEEEHDGRDKKHRKYYWID